MLARLFARREEARAPRYSLAPGHRVYAIGDIHGRLDCLDAALAAIFADEAGRAAIGATTIVLLGDLINRGPDSRGVIERAMALSARRATVCLMGNHEEMLLRTVAGDPSLRKTLHVAGGRATALSYGITAEAYDAADLAEMAALLAGALPAEHLAFLAGFRDRWTCGDVTFVHAGLLPGTPLDEQTPEDLRWIKRRFTDHTGDFDGRLIVHGHSITPQVVDGLHRIGVDTGAYQTGRLSVVGLEGEARWFLEGRA